MQKISIHNEEKVKELLENNWEKTFRYSQIENAIYKNFITDFDEMTTLSKNVRELLKENCFFDSLTLDQEISSDNEQTTKMLWKTSTWEFIESVIMRHLSWRVTLCVSCQAGCPMACSFCATWKLGLQKNLTAYEIIEQIFYAAKMINSEWARLRNIVFMWMWEPFLNYNVVKEVIQFASHQKKFDLWNRRITVSTCWIVPWIIKFTEDFPQTSLAVSLHAPNDEIRKSIMPVANKYPLKDVIAACDYYFKKTGRRVSYEYSLVAGINDNIDEAKKLVKLINGRNIHVNLIPVNPISERDYKQSSKFKINEFKQFLEKRGINATVRREMGRDIEGACGQLRRSFVTSSENNI